MMAKKAQSKPKHKFDKRIEDAIASVVIDSEYRTAQSNNTDANDDFEAFVDLFDSERTEREADWMSDIFIPEFFSHMITQSSIDADQYFQTRDFVEAYLQDESNEAVAQAGAAKELINRTLNQKHLHHFQKYIRAKSINHLQGNVYLECWWEQETRRGIVGTEVIVEELDVDEFGNPMVDFEVQIPARRLREVDVEDDIPVVDRFNYEVYDPRNVFTDNQYVYSLQDKQYVTFRLERTLEDLKIEQAKHGYFNLDVVEDLQINGDTETRRDTKKDDKTVPDKTPSKQMDILRRYGKFWTITKEQEDGSVKVKPGLDINGNPLNDAELLEVVITYALVGSGKVMIGYHLTPYLDADGNPFRPIIRGLCYIHPTNDEGMGDGKASRELQVGINDTFNLGNDRVQMATFPTFVTKKYANDDNDTMYLEPGHNMELEDPSDFKELKISDNIVGAMNQIAMLTSSMDKATSIFPTTMGGQVRASTTATAIAGAESRSDMRTNYKSVTFEHTALSEMYWMIQQMTYRFAHEETAFKLMGDKLYDFDPSKDYYYKPVSSSIESEQSKSNKIRSYIQILGYISSVPHPDVVNQINQVLTKVYEYMGDEYVNFGNSLLRPEVPLTPQGGQGGSVEQGQGGGASNQFGFEQSAGEQSVRGAQLG